jgi:hypothetical protein
VGFGLTIPVFERAKTVQALDRAATVIGGLEGITRVIAENLFQEEGRGFVAAKYIAIKTAISRLSTFLVYGN